MTATDALHSRESAFCRTAFELCKGMGVEIGALDKPFDLDAQVIYLDRDSTDALKRQYADDPSVSEVRQVHVVWRDSRYPFFDDGAFDFVISSHVLEHVANPGRQIEEWLRIVRPGGIVYMVVPDKRHSFDRLREVTSIEHLMDEFERDVREIDRAHYADFHAKVVDDGGGGSERSEAEIDRAWRDQHSIHVHTFTEDSLEQFLLALSERVRFELWHYEAQGLHLHCALRKS
jgi:SAM-dependent methyltransferase